MAKRLRDEDIQLALESLRRKYDDFIIQYTLPPIIKRQFEDRYLNALRIRVSLDWFFKEEEKILHGIIEEELDRRRRSTVHQRAVKRASEPKKHDFADQIIEELKAKIQSYPEVQLHEEASLEIKKLSGAIISFERDDWPVMNSLFRKVYPVFALGPRIVLENKMFQFCPTASEEIPPRLSRYVSLLKQFPRDYKSIEREEKNCILEAAHLLHGIKDELYTMKDSPALNPIEINNVEKVLHKVHTMLQDFRLKDLKPQT
jgi:hypothetical protein